MTPKAMKRSEQPGDRKQDRSDSFVGPPPAAVTVEPRVSCFLRLIFLFVISLAMALGVNGAKFDVNGEPILWGEGGLPTRSEITKAKDKYREAHPRCEICRTELSFTRGSSGKRQRIAIHHIETERSAPEKAASGDNFRGFCTRHHQMFGHGIGFGGTFQHENTNLIATIEAVQKAFADNAVFVKH